MEYNFYIKKGGKKKYLAGPISKETCLKLMGLFGGWQVDKETKKLLKGK
jgi:hypothetical protein